MSLIKNEKGAIFIEAAVVIPLLMVVMMLFVYLINIFIVQSLVQYSLNQTVNELGNYTYYLDYVGMIEWSDSTNGKLANDTEKLRSDIDKVSTAYNDVVSALNSGKTTLEQVNTGNLTIDGIKTFVAGASETKGKIETAKGSVSDVWSIVKQYAANPMELVELLKSQALLEAKNLGHSLIGALLGKMMMDKYIDADILEGCGVVSTSYNGTLSNDEYLKGIDGMDFSASSFLGSDDTRVIDLVVVYRIKFPFNLSGFLNIESGPLYDNSLLIVQRAVGYGWVNGDATAKGKYNGTEKKGFSDIWS